MAALAWWGEAVGVGERPHRPVEVRRDDELELMAATEVDDATALHLHGLYTQAGRAWRRFRLCGALALCRGRPAFFAERKAQLGQRCRTERGWEKATRWLAFQAHLEVLVDECLQELKANLAADDCRVGRELNKVADETAVVRLGVAAGVRCRGGFSDTRRAKTARWSRQVCGVLANCCHQQERAAGTVLRVFEAQDGSYALSGTRVETSESRT